MTIHPMIKPRHLAGTAYVYLRQSSPGQVRRNHEGRQRQQAMVGHVAELGWPETQIVLLDGDTAQSGSSQHGRTDFQALTEAIINDKVGLVAARELSRLVRDNQDWAQLVRICRFQDVLLADEQRLYDPANPQDRMVLGIQGAFNEFELSMILDRMHKSLLQKAQRGEQYDALPSGYICRHACLCEKHPDKRVQRAIEKVLKDFERFPSANQLYLRLISEGFQFPVVPRGHDWRDVQWSAPSYSQILRLVGHPVYAGIYVRGRCQAFVTLDEHGHKQTTYRHVPREKWTVFLEDHHEAYISKQDWERNVQKIAANANVRSKLTKGAVGRGESLMAGLLRCRRCGNRLQTSYPSRGVRYFCAGGKRQRQPRGVRCLSFHGSDLEAALAEEILEVVSPAGVAAAQRAADSLASQHLVQRQLLVDRVQTTREAADRASREYKQTDVTYTVVRQVLGSEWEAALSQVAQEESRLATFDARQPELPTPDQKHQLMHLSADVRKLWNHPHASNSLKQELVRVLITEIVVDVDGERDEVTLTIQWSGGHHTELRCPRSSRSGKLSSGDLKTVVDALRKVQADGTIAGALNRVGIRTNSGETWTGERVERYRQRAGISAFDAKLKKRSHWLTQSETATRLSISPMSVHRLVRSGVLPAEQPRIGLPMVITATDLDLAVVQCAVKSLKSGHRHPLPDDSQQLKLF